MATTPVNVTQDEFLRRAAEKYQEMVKAGQIQPPAGEPEGQKEPNNTPAPNPLALEWNGETRQFSTQQELQTFIQAEVEKARRSTLEEVTSRIPGAYVNPNAPPPVPPPPKIDVKELAAKLEKDPIEAWNYVDEARFGTKNVPAMIQEMAQRLAAQEQYAAVSQFRLDHPEYQATPENSRALLGILQSNNMPLTYDSLDLAYNYARQRGLIQVQDPEQDTHDTINTPPPPRPVAGPPRVGRQTGAPGFDILAAAETMPADDLAKYISSLEGNG